jgi:hypothetical protein
VSAEVPRILAGQLGHVLDHPRDGSAGALEHMGVGFGLAVDLKWRPKLLQRADGTREATLVNCTGVV